MVTTKLNLSMTEPQVRQIYAKQGDTGRVLDITLDQTPEDGTLRILRPDGVEVTSEAVTGGEVSESGETVTFDSMTEADVTELTVGIEPVQDLSHGDPSPTNICPITGHDEVRVTDEGTNLLNYDAWKTVSITRGTAVWENNGVTLTATSTDCFTEWSNAAFPQGARVSVTEGETITLAWDATPTWLGNAYIFPNGQTSGLVTAHSDAGHLSYTVASGVTYLTFRFGVSSSGVTESYKNIQIVRGTTVPTWTPYVAPNTYTTSLGQTVYGGTLDMASGVLTVDSRYLTVNDFTFMSSGTSAGGLYWVNVPQTYPAGVNDNSDTNVCSHAPYTPSGDVGWGSTTPIYTVNSSGYPARIYVDSTTYADFQSKYATLQVVYKLAEPVTYQLTAQQIKTLIGTNNVWASSGDIINITFTYGGLLSELPSEATEIVGKCYCDVEQNGVSSMPFTLNVKKNERES